MTTIRTAIHHLGPVAAMGEVISALKLAVCAVWATAIVTALPLIAREYF